MATRPVDPRLRAVLAGARQRQKLLEVSGWTEKDQLLLAECHPKQRGFVVDPGRRVCALTGRGGGKTTAVRVRYVRRMQKVPKARTLYIATTRDQAAEFMWEPLKELCDRFQIQARFAEQKLKCTFKNKSFLRLVGADDKKEVEKQRGQPFHEVWIDESASHPAPILEALLFKIIGPRLGDFGGMLGMVGTPGHILKGRFYDATRNGSSIHRKWEDRDKPEYKDFSGWSFHKWNLLDGAPYVPALARLWAEALIEKADNKWSDDNPIWRREYLGEWAADDTENVYKYRPHLDDGTPWNEWNPQVDRWGFADLAKEFPKFKEWHYTYGMDLGHSDPFALEILAWCPYDPEKRLFHVYEYVKTGMYAKTIAEHLTGKDYVQRLLAGKLGGAEEPGGVLGHTGWPEAIWADTAGLGEMVLDELSKVYGIQATAAEKKNKFDAIELFNGDLIDGRVKVLANSKLAEQLGSLQWAVDDFGKLKEDKAQANHSTDAAIYARRGASHMWTEDEPKKRSDNVPVREPPEKSVLDDEADFTSSSLTSNEFADILDDGNYQDDF